MYAALSCYPPLGQTTTIPSDRDSVSLAIEQLPDKLESNTAPGQVHSSHPELGSFGKDLASGPVAQL